MPPPLRCSGVIAFGNDRSDEGIAPYGAIRSATASGSPAALMISSAAAR